MSLELVGRREAADLLKLNLVGRRLDPVPTSFELVGRRIVPDPTTPDLVGPWFGTSDETWLARRTSNDNPTTLEMIQADEIKADLICC